ncbi:hypothetical protein MRX96_027307 [Rhipicephalus microplus]
MHNQPAVSAFFLRLVVHKLMTPTVHKRVIMGAYLGGDSCSTAEPGSQQRIPTSSLTWYRSVVSRYERVWPGEARRQLQLLRAVCAGPKARAICQCACAREWRRW